jgi:hypothetical protein
MAAGASNRALRCANRHGAQEQAGGRIPRSTCEGEATSHADSLIVAEPDGDLVCANRWEVIAALRVHFGPGPGPQANKPSMSIALQSNVHFLRRWYCNRVQ